MWNRASRRRRLPVLGQQWGLNVGGAEFEVSSTFEIGEKKLKNKNRA